MVWVPFLLHFPPLSHPMPTPMPKPSTSSSCAPDSSISGIMDCTGRGPLGEKAPRGRDTSRGQSSSGGSPIRLWGTGELWSGVGVASCSSLHSSSSVVARLRMNFFSPLPLTYSNILLNWSASEFPQKRGLR